MTNGIKRAAAVCAAACLSLAQCATLPADVLHARAAEPDFSVLGAVGVFTAEETAQIAEVIYDGLEAHASRIVFADTEMPMIGTDLESIDSLGNIYRSVISGWDVGILTLKNSMSYSYNIHGVTGIAPKYLVEDAVYEETYNDLMAEMDEIVSGVDSDWTAAEKALYIHEWMADAYDFDNTDYENESEKTLRHTAYGMLKRDIAVCEGYAWLYNLLMRRVGIESVMVISENLLHAWNLVEIDGVWYHVDVTWDDVYEGHPGLVQHTNLLKSSEAMVASGHNSEDWKLSTGLAVSEMNVGNLYDDVFWAKSCSAVRPYHDDMWMTIIPEANDRTTGLFQCFAIAPENDASEITTIMSLSERWYALGSTTQYYGMTYIAIDSYEGDLYYSTPQNVFALRGNSVVWLFGLTEEQKALGNIYGMHIEDGILYYYVSSSARSEATEYSVNLGSYRAQIDAVAGTQTTETTTTTEESTTTETTTTTEESTTTETTTTTEESTTTETTTTEESTTTETTTTEESTTTETTTTEESTTTETTTTEESTTTETTTTEESTTTETTTTEESTTTETTTTEESTTTETTTTEESTTTETTTTEESTTTETTTTEESTTTETTTTEESTTTETTTTEESTTTEPESLIIVGDANGDGVISVVDIVAMQRYLLGGYDITAQQKKNSDLTRDGAVNGFDLALLKRQLLRIRQASLEE